MPLKSHKICSKIFEHGFDPPPFEQCSKKLRIWGTRAPLNTAMQVDENQEDRGKGETGIACLPPPRESKSAQWLCSPGVNTMYCPDWNHTMNNKLCKWHCAVSISITLTNVSFQNSSYPIPLQWNIMKKLHSNQSLSNSVTTAPKFGTFVKTAYSRLHLWTTQWLYDETTIPL